MCCPSACSLAIVSRGGVGGRHRGAAPAVGEWRWWGSGRRRRAQVLTCTCTCTYAHVVHVTTSCLVQAERPWSCLDVDAVRSALESELGGARYELDGVRCTVSRVQMRKCGGAEETNAAISQPVISAALLAPWLAPHGTWWVHAHAPVHDHGSRRKVHGECMHVLLSACAACSVCCAWHGRRAHVASHIQHCFRRSLLL